MSRKLVLVSALFVVFHAATAHAFYCIRRSPELSQCVYWGGSRATMLGFLGTPGVPLINGTVTWDQNLFNAANDWNAVGAIQFTVENGTNFIDPCGAGDGQRHICANTGPLGNNPVFFASSFCGTAFGDIIELTNNCWNRDTGQMFNAPVFVNANVLWNAYDGPIRFSGSQVVYDIRRVLLHELGHALGLDHPDDHGQLDVQAIMRSHVGNIDRLQADDINGARSIYSSVPVDPSSPSVATNGCQLQTTHSPADVLFLLSGIVIACKRHRLRTPANALTTASSKNPSRDSRSLS